MKQKIFFTLYDAECAAFDYTESNPGTYIVRKAGGAYDYGVIDDRADAEEDPRFTENVGVWGGEVPAIVVLNPACEIEAKFGWWEDEID